MIDYEGRANPILGLGFCYDDVPYGRGPNVSPAQEAALFRVANCATQHKGVAFSVVVEAIDAAGTIRTSFQGRVRLVQEDASIGTSMPSAGIHINGTAAMMTTSMISFAVTQAPIPFPSSITQPRSSLDSRLLRSTEGFRVKATR